jgi:hypothetical protein
MPKMYVIMKQRQSPIAITTARAHEVQPTLKGAKARTRELNAKATNNTYWIEGVPFRKDA